MDEQRKSFFDMMSPKQTFVVGAVIGFLVLCAVGFFILLGLQLKGGLNSGGGDSTTTSDFKAPEKFSKCLDDGKYAATVKQDAQLGSSLGAGGTPATFVDGYFVSGALPFEMIKQVIDTVLAGNEPKFDFMKDENGNLPGKVNMPELEDAIWRGNEDAKVTLVEFSDFECPFCQRFESTIDQVLADYGDKVKFTYRNFPLTSIHSNAQKAAEAFECAKEQGKGWEMHDKLFELSAAGTLGVENYKKAAAELGLK